MFISGVSPWRVVLFCAAVEPTWSKNAFSPVTDSSETQDRNRLPCCCDNNCTLLENWLTKAVLTCVLIFQFLRSRVKNDRRATRQDDGLFLPLTSARTAVLSRQQKGLAVILRLRGLTFPQTLMPPLHTNRAQDGEHPNRVILVF